MAQIQKLANEMKISLAKRWRRAQAKEKSYYRRDIFIKPEDKERIIQDIRANFIDRQAYVEDRAGFPLADFRKMCVLEIGGPQLVDRDLLDVKAQFKILLDPLLWLRISDDCEMIQALGEYIPLRSNSIHLCWTTNAIDHCSNPPAVLHEIRRILTKDARLVISCNVFSSWTRPLFPIFNELDGPHPWHFTRSSFLQMLRKAGFDCEAEFTPWKVPVKNWKTLLGAIAGVRGIMIRCVPSK